MDDDWQYDLPETLRGMMQRGHGLAVSTARVDSMGAQIVSECLRRDYRWDWQVDHRYVYLARLMRELSLDVTPLATQMYKCGPRKPYGEADPADDANEFDIAAGVLEALARAGNDRSREVIRSYVSNGVRWLEVLEQIADAWPPDWWDDLWEIAAHRLQREDARELFAGSEPWLAWAKRDPRIDAILEGARKPVGRARADGHEDVATGELIAILGTDTASRSAKSAVLAKLRRREPAPELLSVARGDNLDLPGMSGALRRLGSLAVNDARVWTAQRDHPLAWAGEQILAQHGDDSDIPTLLKTMEELDAQPGWCGYDTITAGLARIMMSTDSSTSVKDRVTDKLLVLIHESPHTYERASYLDSLLTLDPARTEPLLPNSLLDCEPGVRLFASKHTPLTEDARAWLAAISSDPIEEDDVRAAAAARL